MADAVDAPAINLDGGDGVPGYVWRSPSDLDGGDGVAGSVRRSPANIPASLQQPPHASGPVLVSSRAQGSNASEVSEYGTTNFMNGADDFHVSNPTDPPNGADGLSDEPVPAALSDMSSSAAAEHMYGERRQPDIVTVCVRSHHSPLV